MSYSDDIQKALDRIESPLVRQTVDYLISNLEKAEPGEDQDVAKSALLMYMHSVDPTSLRSDLSIGNALQKSFDENDVDTEPVDAVKELKKLLKKNGILFFGPLEMEKHLLTGPDYVRPLPKPKHGKNQEPHGNRPGKRETIGHLADLRHFLEDVIKDPSYKAGGGKWAEELLDKIPRRKDLLEMSNSEVLAEGQKYLGMYTTGQAKERIRSVRPDPEMKGRFRRRTVESDDGMVMLVGRGAGKNTTRAERLTNLQRIFDNYKAPPTTLDVVTEKPRVPGRDVVDYEAIGAGRLNEDTLAEQSDIPGMNQARAALGTATDTGSVTDHPTEEPIPGRRKPSDLPAKDIKNPLKPGAQGLPKKLRQRAGRRLKPVAEAARAERAGKPAPSKPKAKQPKTSTKAAGKVKNIPASVVEEITGSAKPKKVNTKAPNLGKKPGAAGATRMSKIVPADGLTKNSRMGNLTHHRLAHIAGKLFEARRKALGVGSDMLQARGAAETALGNLAGLYGQIAALSARAASASDPAELNDILEDIRELRRQTIVQDEALQQSTGVSGFNGAALDAIGAGETIRASFDAAVNAVS